ncbi:MAG: MBL fold metallo-hydrolase [Oscillospiraceae bacterium]|nr:MBL fold metallo-hydrolase [Oscillospiraceae bacterium]
MKLTWYGHACFRLETDRGSLVFDPYEDDYLPGLRLPKLSADAVICSHGHGDHSNAGGVELTGASHGLGITQIPCFHDEVRGLKRGRNLITVAEAEGKRVAHLGDLGHQLSRSQLRELGAVDVLLIPVGGIYTLDAAEAKKLCDLVKPRCIVPMHYRCGERGLQNVAESGEFLSLYPESDIQYLEGSSWEVSEASRRVVVFRLS